MFYSREYPNVSAQSRKSSAVKGFALIVALSLMSFSVLLLLSLATLVRTETEAAQIQVSTVKARLNALLGLQVALGDLQRYAGKDQTITVEADIFSDLSDGSGGINNLAHPHWVGVWDSSSLPDPSNMAMFDGQQSSLDSESKVQKLARAQHWLVSGDPLNTNPTGAGAQEMVTLLRAKDSALSAEYDVEVPLVEIIGSSGNPVGTYAFWVDDESTKANVRTGGDEIEGNGAQGGLSESDLKLSVAQRTGVDILLDMDPFIASTSKALSKSIFLESAEFALDSGDFSDGDHDFTSSSKGLLTNTQQGGLRKDLTLALRQKTADVTLLGQENVNPEDLPSEMVSPLGTSGDALYTPYLFRLENVSLDDPWVGSTTGVLRGPRWQVFADYFNLHRRLSGGTAPSLDLRWTQGTQLNSDRSRAGVESAMVARNQRLNTQSGTVNPDQPQFYKGMLLDDALGSVYRIDADEEPIAKGIHPILTEFAFITRLEFVSNANGVSAVQLRLLPVVELYNPTNVAIDMPIGRLEILLSSINVVFDFSFEDTDGAATAVYSSFDSSSNVGDYLGRTIEHLVYSRGGQTSDKFSNFRFSIPSSNFGDTLGPGETRSFRAISYNLAEDVFIMQSGGAWNASNAGITFPLRPYQQINQSGGRVVDYANSTWLDSTMDDYEVFNLRVMYPNSLRYLAANSGNNTVFHSPRQTEISLVYYEDSNPGNGVGVDMNVLQSGRLFFEDIALDNDLDSSPLAFEISERIPGEGSVAQTWIGFDLGDIFAVRGFINSYDEVDPSLGDYLATSNPRAVLITRENGLSVDAEGILKGASWGAEITDDTSTFSSGIGHYGSTNQPHSNQPMALFEVPHNEPVSLGDFAHLDLANYPHEPGYAVGGGLKPWLPAFPANQTWFYEDNIELSLDSAIAGSLPGGASTFDGNLSYEGRLSDFQLDLSYHLNARLWDTFFLSTLPASSPLNRGTIFPNTRVEFNAESGPVPTSFTAEDFDSIAQYLYVNGPFNVNSTSVKAWAAALSSMSELTVDAKLASESEDFENVFVRMLKPLRLDTDDWQGPREITDEEIFDPQSNGNIEGLAQEIVDQVKARGPFLSLGHFVNRQLVNDARGEAGALQAAIASSGINGTSELFSQKNLIQQDILRALGPVLSVRGDTFRIRVKGTTLDSITNQVIAEAYCEAIVQRLPEYIDSDDTPDVLPDALSSTLNSDFGRRFKIVALKWISPEDV